MCEGAYLFCLTGELHTELADGRKFTLTAGASDQVADSAEPHRSHTEQGATLFIVDSRALIVPAHHPGSNLVGVLGVLSRNVRLVVCYSSVFSV